MESVLDNYAFAFIVEDIFSYLNCHELAICRMVCKSWKDLIDNYRLWWLWKMRKIRSDSIRFPIWKEAFDYFERVKNVFKIQILNRFLYFDIAFHQATTEAAFFTIGLYRLIGLRKYRP